MKFERNMSFSAEEFSDGEVLLYDDVSEVYHILNSTAAQVLTILEKYGYEESKKHYVKWAKQTFDGIQNESLEEDYDILIRDLLDKRIIIIGNTTV